MGVSDVIAPTTFKSILLPVDLWESPASLKHLAIAAAMARANACPVHALTVLPDMVAIEHYRFAAATFDEVVVKAEGELRALLGRTMPAEVTWTSAVARGDIYKEILRTATERGADLIVMAAHRPRMTDFLIGSNAEKVVRHAKCSVLIVRGT